MDAFYDGVETSLLALSLAIGIAVAAIAAMPADLPHSSITLPPILIVQGEAE